MGGVAVKGFGGFHQGLRQRGVRVNGQGEVLRGCAHLHREHPLGNQFSGPLPYDADAQNTLGVRFDNQFRQAVRAIKGQRPARSRPRELAHLHRDALGFRFSFGHSAPRDFGVGEDDCRDGDIDKRALLANNNFHRDPSFLRGFMSEQHAPGDVANRVDRRVGRLLLLVHMDEPLFVEGDLGVLQAEVLGVRRAANGDEDAVIQLLLLLPVRLRLDFDLFAAGAHLADPGLEPHFLERFLGVSHNGPGEIGVGARKYAIEGFDQNDFAAERGINGPQLHADVSAADHQQILGYVLHFQSLSRSHHARIPQIEIPRHGCFRAHGNDSLVIFDELLALLSLHAKGMGVLEVAASLHDLHAAHLGQLRNAAGKARQNGFLPRPQFHDINARRRKKDAATFGFASRSDCVGRVQQGFRRDAALVQTDAAQPLVALNQDNLLAEVRRVKGRGITPRPCAYNYDFSLDWVHGKNWSDGAIKWMNRVLKRWSDGKYSRAPPQHSNTPTLQRSARSYLHVIFFEVLESLHQLHDEARGGSAVDHAMVIGKAQRQH